MAAERKRKVFGLHVLTVFVGLVTAAVMMWQQYIIGPYYWSGIPLLENLLSGVAILAAAITVCEWKIRKDGHFIRFAWYTVPAMAIVAAVFLLLNFNSSQGTHGAVFYGFPEAIYITVDRRSGWPAASEWIIQSFAENVAWGALSVFAACFLVESIAREIQRRHRRTHQQSLSP